MKRLTCLLFVPVLLTSGCALLRKDHFGGFPTLKSVPWKHKNVIVVLGMRSERLANEVVLPELALPRVREADRLYRQCKAAGKVCLILASGGDPAGNGVPESVLIQKRLMRNGVPKADILIEDESDTTAENARYSSKILAEQAPELTVLVTSDFHLSRALKDFEQYNVHPLPAPADSDPRS